MTKRELINNAMRRKGYTNEILSARIGCTPVTLYNIKSGKVAGDNNVVKVIKELDIGLDEWLRSSDEEGKDDI